MKARQNIASLLKNWLELTQHECRAIQVGRWQDLPRIQRSKLVLQQPLAEAIDRWKIENPEEAEVNPVRYAVTRLLELESRTSELLAVRKREVREKILLLEQALYDIRNFRPACAQASRAA